MNEKLIYTTEELAKLLHVSAPTLRCILRSSNPPPFVRLGHRYVFPVREVTEWLSKAALEREAL